MWHHASCIQGEAGELFDAVKKHIIYNAELTDEMKYSVIEELGDLEFYMEGLRQAFDITRQETLDHNATKLAKRYGDKYSDQSAQVRADKKEVPKEYKTLS
jgi:NTP pyrophosphatase (non-canonical NTP hydrolase)